MNTYRENCPPPKDPVPPIPFRNRNPKFWKLITFGAGTSPLFLVAVILLALQKLGHYFSHLIAYLLSVKPDNAPSWMEIVLGCILIIVGFVLYCIINYIVSLIFRTGARIISYFDTFKKQ